MGRMLHLLPRTMTIAMCACAVVSALLFMSMPVSARSCNEVAAACLKVAIKGGYNKAEWRRNCYEPKRMADCRRTGQYDAPSGKVWPADKK